jgi:hypothetical protein
MDFMICAERGNGGAITGSYEGGASLAGLASLNSGISGGTGRMGGMDSEFIGIDRGFGDL